MATVFKTFLNDDTVSSRTLLHESLPITGTIVSGTYADNNIKNFSHGMFQSVYDYPYLSSSANHIFDITMGYSSNSYLSGASNVQNSKKINLYNQMAQVLVGHDITGAIMDFDRDGDLTAGTKLREVVFLNFSRLLTKDEVKKGTFSVTFLTGGVPELPTGVLTIQDHGAANDFRVNSPAGEYAILYTASAAQANTGVGLIYYQAGIAVITGSVFGPPLVATGHVGPECHFGTPAQGGTAANARQGATGSYAMVFSGSAITSSCDSVRNRLQSLSFNNTTELNSTIYFCRVNHNDFNYSANPTYLSASKLRCKNTRIDSPVSYITTVGLYSADNELLAVAKLSEPLKKTPEQELTLRVRLDY